MSDNAQSSQDVELPKSLNLLHITASGVGIIVGAGIYVLIGPATERAGGLVWLAFLLSAVLCGLTALSYMELSSMFPRTGGEYEYARQVFSRATSFVVGWAMMAGLVVASATVALGFGRYAEYFFDLNPRISGVLILLIVAFVVFSGMRTAAWFIVVLSLIEVGGLVFVVVIGASHIGDVNIFVGSGGGGFEQFSGLMSAVALVFFAFIGFDEVVTLSEETHNSQRTTPIGLGLALGISALLYVAVSIAAVSVLGAEGLARSTYPLADVAEEALGTASADVMSALAMITTTSTVLLCITAASRMMFAMARRQDLPSSFSLLDKNGTPRRAAVGVTIGAAIFVVWGEFEVIAGATDAVIYAMFLAVNLIVVLLRRRQPHTPRPFRIPGTYHGVPVTAVAACGVTVWMMALLDWESLVVGAGILLLGALLHLFANVGMKRLH